MKKLLLVFLLSVIFLSLASAALYTPPQPVDCSNSSVINIWNSIFNIDTSNLKIFQNFSDPLMALCVAFKNNGTNVYYMDMFVGASGESYSNGTVIIYANTTGLSAGYYNLSVDEINSLNNVSSFYDFGTWDLGLLFENNYTFRNISSSSDANTEFVSNFKITPTTWMGPTSDPEFGVYYFGDPPSPLNSFEINSSQSYENYTNFTGEVLENISGGIIIFNSNIPENQSFSNSTNNTIDNSTNATVDNSTNGSSDNSSQNGVVLVNTLENSSGLNSSGLNGSLSNTSQGSSKIAIFVVVILILLGVVVFLIFFFFVRNKIGAPAAPSSDFNYYNPDLGSGKSNI